MTPPRACARRESYRRHTTRGDERRRRWSRGEAAVREACDAAAANTTTFVVEQGRVGLESSELRGYPFARVDGRAGESRRGRASARTSGARLKTGHGERGEGVRAFGMAFRFHLACMVFFRRVVCQLSVLAFERSSGGKTERRAAARRTRAPRTADRRRECPRGRPASSGGRVSAHRPQTEKFTVCAHRARGCWVGDDPPSDASLALCARLMSSRGGVGGVDGDGRDRRSTRPEHWRHQPRCQREKVRYSLRERPSEPAKSSIGQRHI